MLRQNVGSADAFLMSNEVGLQPIRFCQPRRITSHDCILPQRYKMSGHVRTWPRTFARNTQPTKAINTARRRVARRNALAAIATAPVASAPPVGPKEEDEL